MRVGLVVEPRERSRQFRAEIATAAMGSRRPRQGTRASYSPSHPSPTQAETRRSLPFLTGCRSQCYPTRAMRSRGIAPFRSVLAADAGDIQALCGGPG